MQNETLLSVDYSSRNLSFIIDFESEVRKLNEVFKQKLPQIRTNMDDNRDRDRATGRESEKLVDGNKVIKILYYTVQIRFIRQ